MTLCMTNTVCVKHGLYVFRLSMLYNSLYLAHQESVPCISSSYLSVERAFRAALQCRSLSLSPILSDILCWISSSVLSTAVLRLCSSFLRSSSLCSMACMWVVVDCWLFANDSTLLSKAETQVPQYIPVKIPSYWRTFYKIVCMICEIIIVHCVRYSWCMSIIISSKPISILFVSNK